MIATMTAEQWAAKVRQTRKYGICYIPVSSRDGLTTGGIRFTWRHYGRSRQGGGHKHKAYAHWAETGEIVRSKDLGKVVAG